MPYKKLPFHQKLNLHEVRNFLYRVLSSDVEKARMLHNYSEKFLMIPDYWLHLITLLENITIDWEILHSCRVLALSHFYSPFYGNRDDKHIEWDGYDIIVSKCRTYDRYPEGIAELENALTFPHHELEMCYNAYETLSAKPITKSLQAKYEQALKRFDILKTSNFDKNWFDALYSIKNHEIIVINFEYFLGSNYSCEKLWKNYISYMGSKNEISMLHIYRRYVRFFIGDLKMLEKYRSEIERISMTEDVTDFWADTIEFELDVCGLKYAEEIFDRAILATIKRDFKDHPLGKEIIKLCHGFQAHRSLYPSRWRARNGVEAILAFTNAVQKWKEMASKKYPPKKVAASTVPLPATVPSPTRRTIDATTIQKQVFTLPLSYIYQILISATPETLFKLFGTCKFLFKFHATPLCYQLGVNDEVRPQYFQQSLFIPVSHIINFPGLNRLHIVNSLDWIVETDRKALSKVIPKFHKCTAKFIHIDSQDLTIEEFKFLTKNVLVLHLCNTNIFNEKGEELSYNKIEDLIDGVVRFESIHW